MKVNVLGTEYEIVQANEQDYPYLEQADGFCDTSIKKMTRPLLATWNITRKKL